MFGFGARERRQALVIGNTAYSDAPLHAARNDARSVAKALAELGFNVRVDVDLDFDGTQRLFAEFESDLSKDVAHVGLFYYSGHGLQIEGTNYLMPVGAEAEKGAGFGKLVAVEPLIERMSKHVETRLVMLDACRVNPFAPRLNVEFLRTKGYTKGSYVGDNKTPIKPSGGLAEIKARTGTFIAFAASPGDVAYEGDEEHSFFTTGLLRHIEATDVPLSNLMMRVTDYVYKATNGKQNCWAHSSLRSSFFFHPGSLIMLVGNVIGFVAFGASLLPYSFSLGAASASPVDPFGNPFAGQHALSPPWVIIGVIIAITSFGMFMAGLQRAYRLLRGEPDATGSDRKGPRRYQIPWRQGLFGGFFGGIIAAPIITAAYYFAWKVSGEPLPFGQLLTEIAIACIVIGMLLGILALSFAERLSSLKPQSPAMRRLANPFVGAVVGGAIAGVICGPWTTLYFGLQDRPFVVPHILLLGGVPGTAVMVFSILNYKLERVNLRRLVRSGFAALASVVIVGAVSGTLGWIIANWTESIAYSVPLEWTAILVAGLPYGVVVGVVLGAVFGLALALTVEKDRQSVV